MENPDALHKINDSTYKDTGYNYLDGKTYHQSCLLFVYWQVMESQHVSARVKCKAAVRQYPPNTTPARAREPAQCRYGGNRITETGRFGYM